MRSAKELQELQKVWSTSITKRIEGLAVNDLEKTRLFIEAEKVALLSEIAQALSARSSK